MKQLFTPVLDSTPNHYSFSFDNSSLENFITCSRKAQLHSVFAREKVGDDSALFFGSVCHAALEVRKNAMLVPNPHWEGEMYKLVIDLFDTNPPPPDEWRTADNCIALLTAYNKQYPLADEPFKLIPDTVELPFSVSIGTADIQQEVTLRPGNTIYIDKLTLNWTGRIDGIVELDGSLFIMDHKTASQTGDLFYEDFELSAQMHGYTWAARKLGYNVAGLYLDVLGNRKPTKTGKAHEILRRRYFYEDPLVAEWQLDTFHSLTDFLEHLCRGYFPKGQKWCHGKYGRCPYWEVCTAAPEQRDNILYGEGFRDADWSPLNKQTTHVQYA